VIKKQTVVFSVFGVFRALKTFVRIYCFGQGTPCHYGNIGNINDGGTKKGTLAGALKCCAKRRQFEGLCLFL
jgi:hypothetical protein